MINNPTKLVPMPINIDRLFPYLVAKKPPGIAEIAIVNEIASIRKTGLNWGNCTLITFGRVSNKQREPQELAVLRDLLSQRLGERLQQQKYHLPLFDTDTWVSDFENAIEMVSDRSPTI